MNQTNYSEVDFKTVQTDVFPVYENRPPIVIAHAHKAWRRLYLEARDHFRQADRDLGETAAFVAASLTTATAIEAVMTVANDKLGLSKSILQEVLYLHRNIHSNSRERSFAWTKCLAKTGASRERTAQGTERDLQVLPV